MRLAFFLTALLAALPAAGQWEIQSAPTTADLRGIHAVGNGVAWASGTQGTVLLTTDDGKSWQRCATPPDAGQLDFRGIQASDASTAIVMSSGKGPLSRLYKTTDGCQTWKLVFTNPDPEGFWDALARTDDHYVSDLIVLGDPVNGHFTMLNLDTSSAQFSLVKPYNFNTFLPLKPYKGLKAERGEAAFAASNSSIFACAHGVLFWIGTGGTSGARVIRAAGHGSDNFVWLTYPSFKVPLGSRNESSGVFSINFKDRNGGTTDGVIVGGDYKLPDISTRSAAFTNDYGKHWIAATTPPHGFRSAVAYDAITKTWITVGPNGTDISTDDGRNWRALKPTASEAADADQHWNALSLPFVVGPKGRIGKLRADALKPNQGAPGP
jgi:photosystem II stability/assembly factor-like uncharacterized protein